MVAAAAAASMSLSYSVILLFLLLPKLVSAQTNYHNITLNTILSPLNPPTSYLSPSGDFSFGFTALETDPTLFLLAIWFSKITINQTIIWSANGDNPVRNGSKAELTSDGQLSLKDPSGQEIWNAGIKNASYAAILDNGNLVLSTAESTVKWQSFDHPTDTILPGQVLQQNTSIYSRLMGNDYSRGRFVLALQPDGNLVFYPVAFPTTNRYDAYWATRTFGTGIQLVFNETGMIYVAYSNNTQVSVTSPTVLVGDYYQRATLDSDGVFRQYAVSKDNLSNGNWKVIWTLPTNICQAVRTATGSGVCGFNSYCIMNADGSSDCQCPPHYSFIDPSRKYKGCQPNFMGQHCNPGGEEPFKFEEMINIDWPLSDAEFYSPMNVTECKDNCLKDCFCLVAIYYNGDNGSCWKKKLPLSNGLTGNNVNRQAFIKYSDSM